MAKNTSSGEATRIAPGTQVHGKVSGSEDLSVAGRLEGALHLIGVLQVEPEGIVKADVLVTRAVISGIVVGNIEATESIQIAAGGRVQGDLHAPRIAIVEGARFAGTIEMGVVEAKPVEEASTVIERRSPPLPRVERRLPPPIAPTIPKPLVLDGAVPARPTENQAAYVAPAVVSTRPDARRKRIVVKKRS